MKLLRFDESLPSVKDVFRGIDEHLVLVYHIVQKRIPASFGPKKDGMPPSDHSGKKQDDGTFFRSVQFDELKHFYFGCFFPKSPTETPHHV